MINDIEAVFVLVCISWLTTLVCLKFMDKRIRNIAKQIAEKKNG